VFGRQVLAELTNRYGSFSVEDLLYNGRRARVLFNGPNRAAQSGIALDGNPRLLFDYNQYLLDIAVKLGPRNILMLGGGTMTLPMALMKQLPSSAITVVEINHDLIDLARKFFGYHPIPSLKVIINDAKDFVSETKTSYELILIDIFNAFNIPSEFRNQEFASQLARILLPGGVVATNCIAALSGPLAAPALEIASSYRKQIGPIKIVSVDKGFFSSTPQNLLILSGRDIKTQFKDLSEAYLAR
jgi:spermidine synthase